MADVPVPVAALRPAPVSLILGESRLVQNLVTVKAGITVTDYLVLSVFILVKSVVVVDLIVPLPALGFVYESCFIRLRPLLRIDL